jgi:hypothetical protein
VSLALIAYGARSATRGPGYIGGLGFTAFILLVGTNVVARLKGDDASAVVGWPLLLLLVGAALLVASFVMPRAGGLGGTTQPPQPGAAPPPAPPPPPPYQPPPPQ